MVLAVVFYLCFLIVSASSGDGMAKKKRDAGSVQVKVRMPKQLHAHLMREAKREGQTLNAVILNRVGGSVALIDRVLDEIIVILRAEFRVLLEAIERKATIEKKDGADD